MTHIPPDIYDTLRGFLAEDIGDGDVTSSLLPAADMHAKVISREQAILAGINFAQKIFEIGGASAHTTYSDGSAVEPGKTVLEVSGTAYSILSSERTALNLLSRMSGIATRTHTLVGMIKGYGVSLLATRKTAPGLRYFDKLAVEIGGGLPHRMALYDMILIKDNHLAAGITLEDAILKAKETDYTVEVEVENTRDAITAARCKADIVMLDNFEPGQITKTLRKLETCGPRDQVKIEASGRINRSNVIEYAATGVDMISSGSLTNDVQGVDYSLEA